MFNLKSMMSALIVLALSAGIGVFARDNDGGNHSNNGNGNGKGNGNSQSQTPGSSSSGSASANTGPGMRLGGSMLVQAQDLPADLFTLLPLPPGSDPLAAGRVSVLAAGSVGVTLNGAVASQTYNVWFCRYSTSANRCSLLGTAQTDADGQVHTSLAFLTPGTASAGVFAIARGGAIQFVGGFMTPPAAVQGVSISLEGTVATVTPGTESFTLQGANLVIVTDTSTDFKGVANLPALTVGSTVEISGTLRADGAVLASSVKVE